MAKVKFSKTELKSQRDALKRFARFLPTLLLKKQQLQMEVMRMNEELAAHARRVEEARQSVESWLPLFSVAEATVVRKQVTILRLVTDIRNIAGVDIPVLQNVEFAVPDHDLFLTSPWVDRGIEALQQMLRLRIAGCILDEQKRLLEAELRTTTQRVNLFEKVKIPESRDNIRKIQIYLGDQQTAAVGRAKIAKGKLVGQEG